MKSLKRYLAYGAIAIALSSCTAYSQAKQAARPIGEKFAEKVANSIPEKHSYPPTETWKVIRVADGDTITVVQGNRKEKIRFCGVDANESQQKGGAEAKAYLRSLIDKGDGTVMVSPIETDRYGRTVAELFVKPRAGISGYQSEEEIFLNGEMVRAGLSRVYPAYVSKCPNKQVLEQSEQTAKAKSLGVWGDASSIPPWEWRKHQRQNRGN